MQTSTILGISDSHDSGAALVVDGRLVAAVNEERLVRKKQVAGFPARSIESVLDIAGVAPRDVAAVALAGRIRHGEMPINNDFSREDGRFGLGQQIAEAVDSLPLAQAGMRSELLGASYRGVMSAVGQRRARRFRDRLGQLGIDAALTAYDHHDSHVAAAYYGSGIAECLVLSNDGFGDGLCGKVAVARDGTIRTIAANSFFNSIGVYYNYVTKLCGFDKSYHAGKTTGLAAYGSPDATIDVFRRLIAWDAEREAYVNRGPIFRNALKLLRHELAGVAREDIAAGMQRHLEDVLVAMAEHFVARTGLDRVVLVGGVHANVRANQRIAELPGINEVFVFPHMGDGGLAAGAGYLRAAAGASALVPLESAYLGPAFDEGDILASIERYPCRRDWPDDMAAAIAGHLARGATVARFDGRMEYGPRALGNRSILCEATDPGINARLNARLQRTEFMPFAPVIRAEDALDFLKNVAGAAARSAEFMTVTFDVTERCKREAPAIVHIDGTARPQILHRDRNPRLDDVLQAYTRLTGRSLLVNTSFNVHEKPIVCSPDDAMRAFMESGLDVLAIGPFIVTQD